MHADAYCASPQRPTNNNERWLTAQLTARGHSARVVMQLPDDASVIGHWLASLLSSGHTPILVAGGMGGTHDDKTREGVALALALPLERHAECDSILAAKYAVAADGLGYTEERQRMAMLPRGAELVPNPIGAPGWRCAACTLSLAFRQCCTRWLQRCWTA